ncbi:MAG TPA: sugar transferase [Candidatus Dormibacteraeota bacterium]|nr:sugar transferase [Candidatus Dormibacteraeota bacterium]
MTLGRAYCRGPVKRVFDVAISVAALIVLAPVFLIVSIVVLLASGRPVLFTQERVGMDGRPFRLVKFRTMHRAAAAGLPLTGRGDPRVTRPGRFLRAAKLDELPQLWNVLRGGMSLVGPRPEVPRYVALYTIEQRRVLEVRPGLTDPASVLFRDEEALIGSVPERQRETFYLETVLPKKLRMNLEYIDRASVAYDLALVLKTIRIVLWPASS